MDTATLNSPAGLSAGVLADLKKELSQLRSYTAELGEARASAAESLRAASAALRLVDQLGELQRTQISDLRLSSDATLEVHRQGLVDVTDAWGRHWLGEAAKSLAVLDTIVGRQHQLALEITEFQETMSSAGRFADAQRVLGTQVSHLAEAIRQGSAGTTSSLENVLETIERELNCVNASVQQTAAKQAEAVTDVTSAVRQGIRSFENGASIWNKNISDLDASVRRLDAERAEHARHLEQSLAEMRNEQTIIREQTNRIIDEISKAQNNAHDEIRRVFSSMRTGTKHWNIASTLIVFGTLLAFELFRYH